MSKNRKQRNKKNMEEEMSFRMFGGLVLGVLTIIILMFMMGVGKANNYSKEPCNNPFVMSTEGKTGYYISGERDALVFSQSVSYIMQQPIPWDTSKVTKMVILKGDGEVKYYIHFLSYDNCSRNRGLLVRGGPVLELIETFVSGNWSDMSGFKLENGSKEVRDDL